MNRITFLTGFYGSGKTEIALNLAIQKQVDVVVDLDIINPYFRSREQTELLEKHGIRLLSNQMKDGKHADMPYIGGEVFMPFMDTSLHAIYDLGGNDLGAKLLQQFGDYSVNEPIDLYFVINPYRLETSSVNQIKKLRDQIESISEQTITGLINNSNLLKETTAETILEGNAFLEEVSRALAIPIIYTTLEHRLLSLSNQVAGEVIPFTRYFETTWN